MVCIYCTGETKVVNSRLQRRKNQVWRRRQCQSCQALFTSLEAVAHDQALMVQSHNQRPVPFLRDQLFISLYESCKHRQTALRDATALTQSVLARLLEGSHNGTLERDSIVRAAYEALKHFDKAAAVYYAAYHPPEA